MRRATVLGVALLVFATIPLGLGSEAPSRDGPRADVRGDEVRFLAPGSGVAALPPLPASAQAGRVAFVDREHQNAVSQEVVLAGDGSAGWASWWLNNGRVAKYDPLQGRVWAAPGTPFGTAHGIGASGDGSLATAVLPPTGLGGSVVANAWLLAGALPVVGWPLGTGPQALLLRVVPPCCSGFTDVSTLGITAVATHFRQTGPGDLGLLTVHLPGLVPAWTAPFSDDLNPAAGQFRELYGVDLSADGTTVAVTTYNTVFVFAVPNPVPVLVVPNNSQTVARVSADGSYVALGGFQFQAHLYARDGSGGYTKAWSRNVGHPWVTAVDVADDGTVVVGTFDYRSGNSGKAAALRASDGATLWECRCYGDYVDDVAITPDGARAVAVTWGALDVTAGDVLTAFDGATGAVLFRLLDDVDEAGSLHGVAISDDGTRVLAGGKAVHARTFGNGGQVYGIALDP